MFFWLNRAVRDELFPRGEPARHQVHKILAAAILRKFDKYNPGSDVRDEHIVTMRIKRHGFFKESSFVACDLRTENKNAISILTERFWNDPVVIGGELGPAPACPLVCEGSTPHDSGCGPTRQEQEAETKPEARTTTSSIEPAELSHATIVGTKRGCSEGEVRRHGDGANNPSLPWGLYADSEDAPASKTMRLKVKLGAMRVNGEDVVPVKKMQVVSGIKMNAGNISALRYVRVSTKTAVIVQSKCRMEEVPLW